MATDWKSAWSGRINVVDLKRFLLVGLKPYKDSFFDVCTCRQVFVSIACNHHVVKSVDLLITHACMQVYCRPAWVHFPGCQSALFKQAIVK